MTTATIEQIYQHFSVRRYKPDPVPRETVAAIVAAGQCASSSSNLQAYSVVAVMDAARIARLAELCGGQDHVYQAPVFLAWCADLSRLERVCQARGYRQVSEYMENFLIAAVDAALASQNAALAAESLGLGICYIGGIRNHPVEVSELLGLPQLVVPICGMTLGWPDVEPKTRPRLPLRAVLHWERYDTHGEEQALKEYDQSMVAAGIYAGRQVPVPGVEGEMEDYGWQEHSARRVSQVNRPGLRAALEQRGFLLK
ncbi:MAG: NADPH-dependent oxidoreductase [Anaerolineales bacterium]|nr:NADPH-dependent oxidoreductase [Anaerolineales bacterium]